jgi:hypothetical protein
MSGDVDPAKAPHASIAAPGEGSKGLAKPEPAASKSWKRWVIGWVVLPGIVIGGIFGAGVMLGAHMPESWFTRAVVWLVDLFA